MKKNIILLGLLILSIVHIYSDDALSRLSANTQLNRILLKRESGSRNSGISNRDIKKQLNLKEMPFYERLLFWRKKPLFDNVLMDIDAENIKRYLQANGFLYAEVKTEIKILNNNQVNVIFKITDNEPVVINNVNIIMNDSLTIARIDANSKKRTLNKQNNIRTTPNNIFRDKYIYFDRDLINNSLVDAGFLKSETEFNLKLNDSLSVDVDFMVYPGQIYYTKGIDFRGNNHTSDKTIFRVISFEDSLIYDSELVKRNNNDLLRLGVFRSVQVFPFFPIDKDYVIPSINLIEKPKWTLQTGVGWGSEERFRTRFQLSHHNLLKMADQQDFTFRSSAIEPINLQLTWIQPAMFHRYLRLSLNPFFKREKEPTFLLDKYGNISSLTYNFPLPQWAVSFSHILEQNNVKDIKVENIEDTKSIYNQSTFFSQLDINYSKPQTAPITGFHFINGAGIAGLGFNSPYDYLIFQHELRTYSPVAEMFNMAFRTSINSLREINNAPTIPVEKRLYLGGMQSVRGYKRNEISPVNESNQYIGGRTSLLFNLEARIPVIDDFSTALLIDAGQVWEDYSHYNLKDLKYSAGIGLRYHSPIGVIRLDFAKPVIKDSGSMKFYLTIGEFF